MDSRERLLRFFAGEDIDRLPIWLLNPFHPLGCYADVYRNPAYAPVVARIEAGDCESFDRRGCERKLLYTASEDFFIGSAPAPRENLSNYQKIAYKGLLFEKYVERTPSGSRIKAYIEEPRDLYKLLDIPYVPIRPDLAPYRQEREEFGRRGLYMLDLGDPLGPIYNLMRVEDFAIATLTDYDIVIEFVDEMQRRVLDTYRYFLDNDIADCYFIVGCEFAGPPLISPAKFGEMSERYVKSICDLIRSYGKISIVHYHGFLKAVLPNFKNIGMDALHTIEAPPVGNCTLREAREALGDRTALIGNVQYDDLTRLPAGEIERQVREAAAEIGDGRLILSPTAGPYENTPNETLICNYLAFIDAGLKYGKR